MTFFRCLGVSALALSPTAALSQQATSVPTNGVGYDVKTWGDPASPAVVLMHGWMGTSHTWRKLAPLLAADRFVIVPDMRGYGRSDKPDAGYDAATLSADVLGVMRALVAFVFAGSYPEATLSMTSLDEPLVGFNLDRFTACREEPYGGSWHFGFNTAPGLAAILLAGKEQALVDWIVPLMHAPNPDAVTAEDARIHADGLRAPNGVAGSVGWRRAAFETARQMRAIGEVGFEAPVMAWGGEFGVPVTHAQFDAIRGEEAGGVIPGVGRLPPEEAPEFLAAEFDAFFDAAETR